MNIKHKLGFLNKYPLSLLWALFIFVLCALKISDIPQPGFTFPGIDKAVHFIFFFILTIFIVYENYRQQYSLKTRISLSWGLFILALIYGGGIELLQKYIFTYRSAEWLDLAADLGGCLLAILVFNLIASFKKISIV